MKNIVALFVLFIAASAFTAQVDWTKLGSAKVNFKLDRDVINVKKSDGLFTAIKLKVEKAPVNFSKVVVHFENGGTEDFVVSDHVNPGSFSRTIDLPGNKRFIEKIVLFYDTKNFARKRGVVEVWGKH